MEAHNIFVVTQRGYVFCRVGLSVCLSVRMIIYKVMKPLPEVCLGPRNNALLLFFFFLAPAVTVGETEGAMNSASVCFCLFFCL